MYQTVLAETSATVVIFSSLESTEHVMEVLAKAGITYRVLLGRYDNQNEVAFAMPSDKVEWLISSGLVDGQESLMLISTEDICYLMYNTLDATGNIRVENIGTVHLLTQDEAFTRDAFTFDPADGLYIGTTQKKAS